MRPLQQLKPQLPLSKLSVALSLILAPSLLTVAIAADSTNAADAAVSSNNAVATSNVDYSHYQQIKGQTVVVSASRVEQDILTANASISVVDVDQALTSSRDNIADMLRDQPGVQMVSDGTPGVRKVAIRGEGANRTLLLVNGERLDDQKTKSGAPMLINPFFIERLEVVRGPSSVLYGSDAMGGVVNVITKQAAEEPFSFEGGMFYSSASESFSEYANIMGTLDRFHYAVGAFSTIADDLHLSDSRTLDNTAYGAKGVNGDFSYDILDNLTIGYAGEYFNSHAQVATTTDNANYASFNGEIPKWNRSKHQLYVKAKDISDIFTALDFSVYYQNNDKDYYSTPSSGIDVGVENQQKSYGGNLQATLTLSSMFDLVTGYEMRIDKLNSASDVSVVQGPIKVLQQIDDDNYKQTTHSPYALLATHLTDELTLNTGLRYTYVKTDPGYSAINGTVYNPYNQVRPVIPTFQEIDEASSSQSKTVGSAGLVYQPFTHGSFRLNWSQGFRVPNVQERYLMTYTGAIQLGNPELKPETSNNYELGFRWDDSQLKSDISVFYSDAKDYIDVSRSGTQNGRETYTYQNIAKAKTYGVEASISYLYNEFEPYASLTYLHREYETAAGSSTNTGTPKFKGQAGVRWYGQYLNVDFYTDFASKSKDDDINGSSYMGASEFTGYATYNLKVSSNFDLGKDMQCQVYGSIENIGDKRYQTTELVEEPGRFFTLGVNVLM